MREYEMMIVLSPELDEAGIEATIERVKTLLAARGAELGSLEPWGRRRLAYTIDHFRDGFFNLARFKMSPDQADDLDRALKLNEQVVRHLLIRRD